LSRRLRRARHLFDAAALLVLALLALVFFWPVTLGQGWIPRGGGDLVSFLWPTYSYAAQALQAGRLPLWNHALYSGAPFAADNQSGLFYPPNLFAFLIRPDLPYRAMEWLVVFHVWLAGAAMYAFMRVMLRGPSPANATNVSDEVQLSQSGALAPASVAAIFAAVAWMFSDAFVTHVGNLNIIAVSAWLPLSMACLHLGLWRQSPGWSALAGVVLGVAFLAGHAQMSLILGMALGLYALWWTLIGLRHSPRAALASLALAGLTFAVAAGVAAVSLIPAIEMTAYTARAHLDYEAASEYSLPLRGLAGLFSPLVFGRGADTFWAPWPRVETGYVGVVTLLLAALGLMGQRRKLALFLLGLAALGLLVALGENTPAHRLLYAAVPGFAQLRVPARFVLLASFALAALGGLGVARVGRLARNEIVGALMVVGVLAIVAVLAASAGLPGAETHRAGLAWALTAVIVVLLAGAGLLLAPSGVVAGAALVALAAAELIGLGAWVEVERQDPTAGYDHPVAVAYLQSQPGPTRIDNAARAWSPDAAARHGLEDIAGLHNPLALAAWQTYYGSVDERGSPLYNFLNAQFVIADKGVAPARAGSPLVSVFDEDPLLDIYLNQSAMPRIQLIYDTALVPDGEAAFSAIHALGFDPASMVVIEELPDTLPAVTGGPPPGERNLYYLGYAPEAYTIVAVTPGPAWVVFSEVFYPGWRAAVNGDEVPIWRANFAFRAVYLDAPGTHIIDMRFEPLSCRIGVLITVATALLLAGWGAWAIARRQAQAGRG
jgi:hypothetical protein